MRLITDTERSLFDAYNRVSDDNSRLFQENLKLKDEIKKLKLRIENDYKLYRLELERVKVNWLIL